MEYNENIDVKNIKSKFENINNKACCRYYLEIPTYTNKITSDGGNDTLIVLMMNPSFANCYFPDQTVKHITDSLYDEYKKIYILNTYPLFSPDSQTLIDNSSFLSNLIKKQLNTNIKEVGKVINSVCNADIMIATSNIHDFNQKSYRAIINKFIKPLLNDNNFRIICLYKTSNEYSRHPKYVSNLKNNIYEINSFKNKSCKIDQLTKTKL